MTTFELYVYWKPPLELLEWLEYQEAVGQLPASVQAYLDTWRAIRNDYTAATDCVVTLPAAAHVGELEQVLA